MKNCIRNNDFKRELIKIKIKINLKKKKTFLTISWFQLPSPYISNIIRISILISYFSLVELSTHNLFKTKYFLSKLKCCVDFRVEKLA